MSSEPGAVERPHEIAVLPAAYGQLFDRATSMLSADSRVRAIWLAGTLARGAADAASDLDFTIAVRDADFEAFGAEWREWLAAITPTLVARGLPGRPGSFYALTTTCERIDVVTERVSELGTVQRGARLLTSKQRALLLTLPVPQPARDSVLEARSAALRAFSEQPRWIAHHCDVPWPAGLELSVREFLRRELDLPLGD